MLTCTDPFLQKDHCQVERVVQRQTVAMKGTWHSFEPALNWPVTATCPR